MKRRMRPEDLLRLRWAGDVAISPDGRRVVFVESRVVAAKNRYRRRLMVVDGAATGPRALTQGEQDSAPAWSPDGRAIAFLARRGAFAQVWLLPADGGEAQPLTSVRGGVGAFAWSADGGRLAVVARLDGRGVLHAADGAAEDDDAVPADDAPPGDDGTPALGGLAGDAQGLEGLYRKHNRDVKVIDELHYKMDGVGYFTARRAQILVVDVAQALALEDDLTPACRQLTRGPYSHRSVAWAPDGAALYVVANRDPDYDRESHRDGVYRVPVDGAAVERLSPPDEVSIGSLAVRPDGQEVAYLVHRREEHGVDNGEIWLQATTGGAPRRLSSAIDRPFGASLAADVIGGGPSGLTYAPDGRSLFAVVSDAGACHLVRVDAESGRLDRLSAGDRGVYAYALDASAGRAALAVAAPTMPGDVFALDLGDGREERLTALNRALFEEVWLSEPRRYTAQSADGTQVGSWLMEPYGRAPGERYPAALEIHGGPAGMYGQAYVHEFQVLASAGYAVLYGNPRGSKGYGREHCAAIQYAWGGKDYMDVMATLEAGLAENPWINPERLGVLGGSYGGYMTNWIVGHTDRFKAAVSMRSVVEWSAMMGTGDLGPIWPDRPGARPPWQEDDWYRQQSPLSYVESIATPLLIENQEGDLRCPINQGEMLYTAVRWLGKAPVRFVRYPDEFHGMSRGGQPFHRVHRLRQILEWFGRYLGGEAPTPTVVDRTYRERAGSADQSGR